MTTNQTPVNRPGNLDGESTTHDTGADRATGVFFLPPRFDAGDAVYLYTDAAREHNVAELIDAWADVQTESLVREILSRPSVCVRSL